MLAVVDLYLPYIIGKPVESDGESWVTYKISDDCVICNGNSISSFADLPDDAAVFSSTELEKLRKSSIPAVANVKDVFEDSTVTGVEKT